jgi:hypothetical protein
MEDVRSRRLIRSCRRWPGSSTRLSPTTVLIVMRRSSSLDTSAYINMRKHASAYVSIRQNTSAYVGIRQHTSAYLRCFSRPASSLTISIDSRPSGTPSTFNTPDNKADLFSVETVVTVLALGGPSAYVRIRWHTSAYVSIRQHTHLFSNYFHFCQTCPHLPPLKNLFFLSALQSHLHIIHICQHKSA